MKSGKPFVLAALAFTTITAWAQPMGADENLLAYLPLANDLKNASGNLPVEVAGKIAITNGVAYFPGGKNWLKLPNLPLNGQFAVSLWVKPEGDEMSGLLMQRDANSRDRFFHLMLRRDMQPYLGFYLNDVVSPRSIPSGQWTHLVFQYTGTHQEIWVDGQLLCSRQAIAYAGTNGVTFIGRAPGWRNVHAKDYQGYMREFRVYGHALSPDEIAKLDIPPAGVVRAGGLAGISDAKSVFNTSATVEAPRPFLAIEGGNLTINGGQGEIYDLQATTNFSDWETLATLTNSTGQVEFTDPDAGKYAERFYRVEKK